MQFSDKLTFLMKLSKTTNQELSQAVNLDASYISRLRSGKRKLPSDPSFSQPMVSFFSEKISKMDLWGALWSMLSPGEPIMEDRDEQIMMLLQWLFYSDMTEAEQTIPLEPILAHFSQSPLVFPEEKEYVLKQEVQPYYYGVEGKREAVLVFFHLVLEQKTPRTLYLFSDEEMSWMTGDPSFTAEWKELFLSVLSRGNHIVIIHNISRQMEEMVNAVSNWLPAYLTGLVDSYYYPKLKDDLFQETLFLAPKVCAVISRSLKDHTENHLQVLVREPRALESLMEEFHLYLEECLPLMTSYSVQNSTKEEFQEHIIELSSKKDNMLNISRVPSIHTMPEALAKKKDRELGGGFYPLWKTLNAQFREQIPKKKFMEILSLPLSSYMKREDSKVYLEFPHLQLHYSREDLIMHIEQVLKYMDLYPFYTVHLDYRIDSRLLIQIKEHGKAMVIRARKPAVAFLISHPSLSAAIWQQGEQIQSSVIKESREDTILRLRNYVKSLQAKE